VGFVRANVAEYDIIEVCHRSRDPMPNLRHGWRLGEGRRRDEREHEGNGRFHWVDLGLGHYWDTTGVRRGKRAAGTRWAV
jgi:hypothetical protein